MSQGNIISTGPVRASGYAQRFRKAAFGALGSMLDAGQVTVKDVGAEVSRVNQAIFRMVVEKFALLKNAVINISARYTLNDNHLKITDITVEVYNIDRTLSDAITNELKNSI